MSRLLDVLVHGPVDKVEALAEKLRDHGILCRAIRSDSPPPQQQKFWSAGIVVSESAADVDTGIEALVRFSDVRIPHIVLCPDAVPGSPLIDAVIRGPAPAIQIASRVRALSRLHAMEVVADRRTEVTQLYGERAVRQERTLSPHSVLYVGDASPRFMALQHALAIADTEIVAAFSSYSAFDYLHERPFDAVVLNALDGRDTAFTISSAMRRNARLYHTPVLLLSDTVDQEVIEEAFSRGVSDILPRDADDDEIRDRILSLAAERRRRREAKANLEFCRDPRTLDVETGLFHAGFITSHIQDLLHAATRDNFTFSLCVLDVIAPEGRDRPDDVSAEKARRQFAAMLRHLLRTEDAGARLSGNTFVAVLPFTDRAGVDCVAARISAIAECTAFESEDPLKPFRLSVVSTAIEAAGDETAEAFLERAIQIVRMTPGATA
jgi:two-component system cell cycle response regulator PopA